MKAILIVLFFISYRSYSQKAKDTVYKPLFIRLGTAPINPRTSTLEVYNYGIYYTDTLGRRSLVGVILHNNRRNIKYY